jgi:flagellar motor switch protein FliN
LGFVRTFSISLAAALMPINKSAPMQARLDSILKLEVPFIVVIASRDMPVKEVMNFAPGAILELPKLADEELEILVNNKPIGLGTAVKVGENFGIRVSYVGDLKNRIDALGASSSERVSTDAPLHAQADPAPVGA